MEDARKREIRKDNEQVAGILDQLDANRPPSGRGEARAAERYAYRIESVLLEMRDASGTLVQHAARPRNISRSGMSLLVGNFVYPGTACCLRLTSEYEHKQAVTGKVIRCQYVVGSGAVYEIGVQFDRPIDVAMFHRSAVMTRVLLVDVDEFNHRLLESLAKSLSLQLTCMFKGDQVVDEATTASFDLLLLDVDSAELDGLRLIKELRSQGYSRSVIALTDSEADDTRKACFEAGCTDCVLKPLTRATLEALIGTTRREPVLSTLVHEADMAELIDAFVQSLSDGVSEIEVAFGKQDEETLKRLTRSLKGQAAACGFEMISTAAAAVNTAVAESSEADALREKLNELIRLCLAARPANIYHE